MNANKTGIVDPAAAFTCVWDDVSCKWDAWGVRLADTEYIGVVFVQWANIFIIIWTLMLAYSTKFVFSFPFKMFDRSTKAQRLLVRAARKERTRKQREARKRMRKAQKAILSINRLKSLMRAKKDNEEEGEKKTVEEDKGETPAAAETKNVDDAMPAAKAADPTTDAGDVELTEVGDNNDNDELLNDKDLTPVFSSFDNQIVTADNKAMSILYTGFALSVMYAASGCRIPLDYDDEPMESLVDFLIYSTIGYFLLSTFVVLTAKILLFKVDIRRETLKGNLSVAITVAGICVATSITLRASLMGTGAATLAESIGVTVMYFVIGQIGFILFGFVFQLITTYDDQEEALRGNVAAGIKWAGNLVSLAIVSSSPTEKTSELASFGVFFGIGAVGLLLFDQLVSRIVIPGNLNEEICKDQNWGYALIATSILLSVALSFEALLVDLPCPGTDAWDAYQASFEVTG